MSERKWIHVSILLITIVWVGCDIESPAIELIQDTIETDISNASRYTITFESNGGSAVEPQEVQSGSTVDMPEEPFLSGYAFAGWYIDEALTVPWSFEIDRVSADMVLYAKWILNTVSITIGNPSSPEFTISPADFTLQAGGGTTSRSVNVTPAPDITISGYQWFVNGTWRGEENWLALDTAEHLDWFQLGINSLTLLVEIDGTPYSDSFRFTLEQY